MKFGFKKFLAVAIIGLAASLAVVSSNSNVFADCPKLVDVDGQVKDEKLVVLTYMEENGSDDDLHGYYYFNVACDEKSNTLQLDQKYLSNKNEIHKASEYAFVLTREDGTKIKEVKGDDLYYPHPDGSAINLMFKIPADDLADGIYGVKVFKNGNEIGTFKDVELKKSDYLIDTPESKKRTLDFLDKTSVKDANGKKTNDVFEHIAWQGFDEYHCSLMIDNSELKRLSKDVDGIERESVLNNPAYENIRLVFKDPKTGEVVLIKDVKLEVVSGKNVKNELYSYKNYVFYMKSSEIPLDREYDVEIHALNDKEDLIGTAKLDLNMEKVKKAMEEIKG